MNKDDIEKLSAETAKALLRLSREINREITMVLKMNEGKVPTASIWHSAKERPKALGEHVEVVTVDVDGFIEQDDLYLVDDHVKYHFDSNRIVKWAYKEELLNV